MWIDNDIVRSDLENAINSPFIDWSIFKGKNFFITGATGLIGSTIVNVLVYANMKLSLDLNITALVRNEGKAKVLFDKQISYGCLHFITGSVENFEISDQHFDYIIHGASPTSGNIFIKKPVETIKISVLGTLNMFKCAMNWNIRCMVYMSSMEVYGSPEIPEKINEDCYSTVNPVLIRSSYPESKRMCECICSAYAHEYNIPVKSVRLAQTFGPGINNNDHRVFAEFSRFAINGEDIVLATKGETSHSYLYTIDAATAILLLLQNGEIGQSYNVANEESYCSILEIAKKISKICGSKSRIIINESIAQSRGFAPVHHINLDAGKIAKLGWKPIYSLDKMLSNLIQTMKS